MQKEESIGLGLGILSGLFLIGVLLVFDIKTALSTMIGIGFGLMGFVILILIGWVTVEGGR